MGSRNGYLKPLTDSGNTSVFIANVTFEPGCQNNWHIRHAESGGRKNCLKLQTR